MVIQVLIVQTVLCAAIAILNTFWYRSAEDYHLYLPFELTVEEEGIKSFFRYFVLLNTLLPVSLFVTMEIVKVLQSWMIAWDAKMYYQPKDVSAYCSNTAIMEDLGQINYIFSDKTGTLTRNEMDFKAMTVGEIQYGGVNMPEENTGEERMSEAAKK